VSDLGLTSVRVRRVTSLIALVSMLAGCAAQTAVMSDYKAPSGVAPFEIVDQRPPKEHETRFMSLSITSCNYGVRQAGDQATVPDRITLLRDDLNAALGAQLANKKITLTHYTVVINNARALRNQVYGANAGLIADVMKGFGSQCARDKMDAGWFEPNDVTTPYSPFIVELSVSVDGRAHEIRSVYSPDREVSNAFGKPETATALFAAIKKATDALVASLRSS
jgi:hypothetical protein